MSSILLKAECLIVLRRVASQCQQTLPQDWLAMREEKLKDSLKEISLKEIAPAIIRLIGKEKTLSACRELTAIHLATALFFKPAK